MKEKRIKHYKLHAGTYDFTYHLFLGTNVDKVLKFAKIHFDDPSFKYDFSEILGVCMTRFNYQPIIWVPKFPKTAREHATLAHEALHLTFYILTEWARIDFNSGSEEAFTHLLTKILTDIYGLQEKTRKSSRKGVEARTKAKRSTGHGKAQKAKRKIRQIA